MPQYRVYLTLHYPFGLLYKEPLGYIEEEELNSKKTIVVIACLYLILHPFVPLEHFVFFASFPFLVIFLSRDRGFRWWRPRWRTWFLRFAEMPMEVVTCIISDLFNRNIFSCPIMHIFVIPKSCHHHVIRPLTYLLALNPNTWSGNPCCLSILHNNAQHCAFPVNHEQFLAHTAFLLFSISGATAYCPWSISSSYLNHYVIRGETWYPG